MSAAPHQAPLGGLTPAVSEQVGGHFGHSIRQCLLLLAALGSLSGWAAVNGAEPTSVWHRGELIWVSSWGCTCGRSLESPVT